MKNIIKKLAPLIDMVLAPFVYAAAWLMKAVRLAGIFRLPVCKQALLKVGIFPIKNHYYEPQFDFRASTLDCSKDRNLPGIDWNVPEQLKLLETFTYSAELADTPLEKVDSQTFFLNNNSIQSGDAEYWYQIIRSLKPRNIIEIGSGYSTLMAMRALKRNKAEDPGYSCRHTCIEPYEMPWLEATGVSVIRQKVEEMDVSFFSQLQENDILFIDSSHIIRPQGDVLYEYLELLPTLNKGVIVHIHDIFSPKNYLKEWVKDEVRLWNEQYLLEAFLTNNGSWEILGALNYLQHNHYDKLKQAAPFLTPEREPGSFYIRKKV